MKLNLTTDQAKALLSLIDLAVKQGGLAVASTALFFQSEIQRAAKAESDPVVNPSGQQYDGSGPG